MRHSKADSAYDDALGRMIEWSLRADAACRAPSPAVWRTLERRVQTLSCKPHPRRARAVRRLSHWLSRGLQSLRDHTVSSETIWSPSTPQARIANIVRYRSVSPLLATWPVFSQTVPML